MHHNDALQLSTPRLERGETTLEHLFTQYEDNDLTRAEYRDALKALYARETDVQELVRVRAELARVSVPSQVPGLERAS